jgi:predicted transcriptional regulator of viral defense system
MGNTTHLGRNYLSRYLSTVRSQGRYSFTLDELREHFNLSNTTLNQSLGRLKVKNEIAQIRNGFYAVITPEYLNQGMLPPYLFLDDLMKSLNKKYYLALLSSAALWGAAHQQPMEYFVIVESPAPRSVRNKKLKINFLSKNDWPLNGIVPYKTQSGYMDVASPELTSLDFITYADKFGINRIVTVIQELSQNMKPTVLAKTARQYTNTTAIQRLGYILDSVLSEEKLAQSLWKVLEERKYFPIPLSSQKEKKGETDSKWKVIKNMEIESDL